MWLGILLAWFFGIILDVFPIAGAYSFSLSPTLSWKFIGDVLLHWFCRSSPYSWCNSAAGRSACAI